MADEVVRLLVCMNCKTMEELPDWRGLPEHDEVLAAAAIKHRSAGVPHTGQLFRIDLSDWGEKDKRDEIKKRIIEQLDPDAETGLGSDAYNLMNQLKEDALECFNRHHRNPACNDYKSDEKRLVPDTRAERKELGLSPFNPRDDRTARFLCEHCPVHVLVEERAKMKAGLYK